MSKLKWKVVIDPFMLDTAEFWKAPGMNPADVQTEVLYLPSTHWIERDGSFTNSGRLAQEINGYDLATGKRLSSFGQLKDDGTTTSGNWLYCGSFTEAGNQMARRDPRDPTGLGFHHGWAWNWPLNRRVLYNRASADKAGKPWDPTRAGIAWNGKEWVGDVPDYGKTTPPDKIGAFIMNEEGVARIYSAKMAEGPFPEHYEPAESPCVNVLHEKVPVNPAIVWYDGVKESLAESASSEYPYPCTIYRVVEREHFVTSNVGYLVESMPDFFVELPEGLAKEKGISNGGQVKVWSKRGEVVGTAMVTRRIKPLTVNGQTCYTVGIPIHWGFVGINQGSMANLLTPFVGDANSHCPEFKAFVVNVARA